MEEHSEIVSKLIKRKKPAIPDGFFSNFASQVDQKIHAETSAASLNNKVPEGFFENFYTNLKPHLETNPKQPEHEDDWVSSHLFLSKKPTVPANFFTDFTKTVQSVPPLSRRGRIIKISFWTTAAAACIALLILLNTNTSTTVQPTAETHVESVADEMIDTYADYMDEADMVDYIVENDIQLGNEVSNDDVYDFVSDDLEDIYYELD